MIVIDASTLILMAKTDLLDLFLGNFPKTPYISAEVFKESTQKETFDAVLIQKRVKDKKIIVKKVQHHKQSEKIAKDFKLDEGEAETIALCLENNWKLVGTDDLQAIKACIVLQIEYTTAIDILRQLNKKNIITKNEALIKLKKLEYFGRYSDEILENVKKDMR